MNAVNLLRDVENFFDRNHNLFIRFGGLFAFIFFTMYVPFTVQHRAMQQYEAQQATSIALANELDLLSHQVEFLSLSFDKQQAVLREVECLAQNIYFEARSESTAGKIAVATVTLNRVKEGFARSVCAVVKQKRNGVCQFSWVCQDDKAIRSKSEYKEAQKIAQNILISKRNYGTMDGALYFHADYVNPNWKQTKEFVKKIGRHLFYKES
jgi:hypothetical protein